MSKKYFSLIFFLLATKNDIFVATEEIDSLRALDDQIAYRFQFKSAKEYSLLDESSQMSAMNIFSDDSEEYQCVLPEIVENSKKKILSYSGPSPAELLQPIYDENICSYRLESYWYYELCHGRFLLQYHENRDTKIRTEFYLGNFARVQAEAEMKSFDQLNPPTKKVGDQDLPYFPITYGHGSTCDLTKKPRMTTVMYVCDEDSKNSQIYSLNEVSSCVYEVIVMTNRLCSHPAFHKPPPKELEINCYATKEDQEPKPKALTAIEREASSQFFKEFSLFKTQSKAPSQKNVFTQLFKIDSNDVESGFEQLNAIIEAIKSTAKAQKKQRPGYIDKEESAEETNSLIESFWSGKICLHGGAGWWQYELCYGRMVTQYHDEDGVRQASIVLGIFHDDENIEWAKRHPDQMIEKNQDGKIIQVSNIYTRGDICEETQTHRKCEVRIRCRQDMAAEKIFLHITEPNICSYVLTVESPLFCEGLQNIDTVHGTLRTGMPLLKEFEKTYEPQIVPSIPERKVSAQSSKKTEEGSFDENSKPNEGEFSSKKQEKDEMDNSDDDEKKIKPTKPPFEIGVFQQEQLMELVNMLQNDEVVFRKIVIEKTDDNKIKRRETSEARLHDEHSSKEDKENDKARKTKTEKPEL